MSPPTNDENRTIEADDAEESGIQIELSQDAEDSPASLIPDPPKIELMNDQTIRVSWTIPDLEPPVTNIAVKLRAVGASWCLVDATELSIRAPTSAIRISSLKQGLAYA